MDTSSLLKRYWMRTVTCSDNKKIKVCQIIGGNVDTITGLEKHFIDLCNNLDGLVDLYVIAHPSYLPHLKKTIHFYSVDMTRSRFNIFNFIKIFNTFKKNKFDIVHSQGGKASDIIYVLNKILQQNHIATKHNSRKGAVFNKIKNVIAVSEGVAKSITNPNTHIIYNGIEPIEIDQNETKNHVFTICAIGRLDPIKGFDILIKECAKLAFAFKLEILGDGLEYKNLQKLINSLNLQKKVYLLGFQNNIPKKMANSSLIIQTSHSEGFSMVLTEALFYAPVFISTKVSGAIEVLDPDFLIDHEQIANKIEEIHNNYLYYKEKFQQNKDKKQNEFILSQIIQNYLSTYNKILKKNKDIYL